MLQQFGAGKDVDTSPHMSRIIRNNDIYNECGLSHDITFDQELLDQQRHRAATKIQRWNRSLQEKKLIKEAEAAIAETKNLLKKKKDRLISNYVKGVSESIDEADKLRMESQKENFNLYSGGGPTTGAGRSNFNYNQPESIYGEAY